MLLLVFKKTTKIFSNYVKYKFIQIKNSTKGSREKQMSREVCLKETSSNSH